MAINDSRNLNEQLHRGATDGKLRNERPDSSAADYTTAIERARQLHPMHYGTFGADSDSMTAFTDEFMPDAAVRRAKRDQGIRGY